jgi:hypothetical protein
MVDMALLLLLIKDSVAVRQIMCLPLITVRAAEVAQVLLVVLELQLLVVTVEQVKPQQLLVRHFLMLVVEAVLLMAVVLLVRAVVVWAAMEVLVLVLQPEQLIEAVEVVVVRREIQAALAAAV